MHRLRPTVSVVIPAFNAAAYLGEAIDSVLAQTYQPAEIIVVDDGSEDETSKVAAAYAGKITYIRKERGGPSQARNVGIRAASGEWIGFLDADDLWLPEFLEKLTRASVEGGADVIFCDYQNLVNGRVVGKSLQRRFRLKNRFRKLAPRGILPNPFELLLEVGSYLATPAVLIRREALCEVGLFDESLPSSEDLDLWFRLAVKRRFCPVTDLLMHRRVQPQSLSTNRRTMITTYAEVLDRVERYAQGLPDGARWPKLLQKQKGSLLRSQGAFHWSEGNLHHARESWMKGFCTTRSPKFAAYLLASYLPRSWVTAFRTH